MSCLNLAPHSPRFILTPIAAALFSCFAVAAQAASPDLPTGLSIQAGQAQLSNPTAQSLQVTTSTDRAVLDWQDFSIGQGYSVDFVQPQTSSAVLNRVTGQNPSSILGSLQSNGQVWLLNPNGVIFGKDARINVGGLVASTLGMSTADFMAGRQTLSLSADAAGNAAVVNQGRIQSSYGGKVYLVGVHVDNQGEIDAAGGQVGLLAATSVDLMDSALPDITMRVPLSAEHDADDAAASWVRNQGSIQAQRVDLHGAVVNQEGLLQASSLQLDAQGQIVLRADKQLTTSADSQTLAAAGRISVQAGQTASLDGVFDVSSGSTTGGQIDANAGQQLDIHGQLRADGTSGGLIQLGGTPEDEESLTRRLNMTATALASANALEQGDGGRIILWSSDSTQVAGNIQARGGAQGGDGGFIETSGLRGLRVNATPDASAPQGKAGTWLLDPADIAIVRTGTETGVAGYPDYTSTADSAVILAGNIETALNAGTNVSITTGPTIPSSELGNILMSGVDLVVSPSTTPVSLTLNAAHDITFVNSSITTDAALDLTLNANQSDTDGKTTFDNTEIDLGGGVLTLGSESNTAAAGTWLSNLTIDTSASNNVLQITGSPVTVDSVVSNVRLDILSGATLAIVEDSSLTAAGGIEWKADSGDSYITSHFDDPNNPGTPGTLILPGSSELNATGTHVVHLDGVDLLLDGTSVASVDETVNFEGSGTITVTPAARLKIGGKLGVETVNVQGTVNNKGTVEFAGNATSLSSGATIYVDGGSLEMNPDISGTGGTFTNNGAIIFSGTVSPAVSGDADWENRGSVTANGVYVAIEPTVTNYQGGSFVLNDATLDFAELFTNDEGSVFVGPGSVADFQNGFLQQDGVFTLEKDSTHDAWAAVLSGSFEIEGGLVEGSGILEGDVNFTGGTLAPGASPGWIDIQGNLYMGSGSTLSIEIDDSSGQGTGHDYISVSGSATLDGLVDFSSSGGFTPNDGDTFIFLEAFGAITPGNPLANYNSPVDGWDPSLELTLQADPNVMNSLALRVGSLSSPLIPPGSQGSGASHPNIWSDWEYDLGAMQDELSEQGMQQPQTPILDAVANYMIDSSQENFLTPQPDEDSFLRVIDLHSLTREETGSLLQDRSAYMKALFAEAIQALTENPDLADVADCAAGASSDGCLAAAKSPAEEEDGPRTEKGMTVLFGLDRYQDARIPKLANPVSDARAIGQAFARQMNYDVQLSSNATKADMLHQFNQLIEHARPQDSVVIYFAGHGQMVDATGMGYWLPSDASASNPRTWISNKDVSRALSRIRSKQIIVFADACYSGTLAHELRISSLSSAAEVQELLKHRAVTVMTSGSEEPVADGGKEGHSVFAWNLLQQLEQVEHWQTTAEIFSKVRQNVVQELPQQPMYGAIPSAGHEAGADFLVRASGKQK